MPGDDELSLDFSKVGDFFKRKKKAEKPAEKPAEQKPAEQPEDNLFADKHASVPDKHPHPPESVEKDDSEITIDFSKVKKWFKKPGAAHDAPKDELGFDFGKAFAWVKAHPILVVLLLLLILQFVPNRMVVGGKEVFLPWGGMWMRLQGESLPPAEGWAVNHVHGIYKAQLANAINQQYPNLPDERRNKLVEEEWQKLVKEQGATLDQQVQAVTQQIKGFWQYEHEGRIYTYMPDIDPYTYLRYARNLVEKGQFADEIRDGEHIDTHMIAPVGGPITLELQPYVLAFIYYAMRIFHPTIPLMQAATYFPIIFILLALIPAFFIGRRFAGMPGGIIAATMIAISPSIIARTTWGHADTDPWNILFPLLLTWLYILMIDAESTKKMVAYGAIGGFVTGLYAFAWRGGWWYVFDFLVAAFGILVLSEIIRNFRQPKKLKEILKNRAILGATYAATSFLFVAWFVTPADWWGALMQPLRFTVIKAAAHPSLWPNVYTTVAELNPINLPGIIGSIGGWLYFWIALAGIVMLLVQRKNDGWTLDLKYGPLLTLWFVATMYASTKGVRFTLLLAPAFALAFGIALGKIYQWAVSIGTHDLKLNAKVCHAVMILIIAFLLAAPARGSYGTSRGDIPIMNDAWWAALNAIKDDSKPDAIINSWWDFGHHFKYVADRPVTFDGASQNSPMAHWIGRVLTTGNETEAVGILRMLDCGSRFGFDELNERVNDPVRSIGIMYRIIGVSRAQARQILARENVSDPDKILDLTHCDPPENYFIASDDMIGKSGVWSHFGLWDFKRAKLWIELRHQPQEQAVKYMVKEWGVTEKDAEDAYFQVQGLANENDANAWISPWLGIIGTGDCNTQGNEIVCTNGLRFNTTSKGATIAVQGGSGIPPVVSFLQEDGSTRDYRNNNSNIGVSAILGQTGPGTYRSVFASEELLKSVFVRLYFFEGHGLRHFRPFNRQQMITGGLITTYKIDWKGAQPVVFSGFTKTAEQPAQDTGAKQGDTVGVYYIGSLMDGSVFDSSIKDWRSKNISIGTSFDTYELNAPLQFTLGAGQVIEGFDAAILGMDVGEEQIVQIPPNAAYGFDPKAHPLGNKTLRFKIRLASITPKN
jgi:dolichyl-diphosphooligosaccharide--protein glycosyltransferase